MNLSVVTPVLNGQRYLRECLDSVLTQEIPVEHVLVDGGSTDGTLVILEEYAARYPGRVVFSSGPDRGACDAWNKGIAMARGEILGWLGADDRMAPGAARTVAAFFEQNPRAEFVYGETEIIDADGQVIGRYATADFDRTRAVTSGNGIPAMATWFRRNLYDAVGAFDVTINLCDCDYWIRAGGKFHLFRLPEVLASFRLHGVNVTDRLQKTVYPEEDFLISRRHGGGWFTPIAFRYYRSRLREMPGIGTLMKRREAQARERAAGSARFFRRVAVFGAALTGQKCARMLDARGVEVMVFLDNFPPPGRRFLDRPVVRPQEWAGDDRRVDAVYIASAGRHAEMRSALRGIGWSGPVIDFRD